MSLFAQNVWLSAAMVTVLSLSWTSARYENMFSLQDAQKHTDICLWIDERQVRMFSGINLPVYAIHNGNVSGYILDPNFSHKLPIIPFEVGYVNFTWQSCCKKYCYHFDTLTSSDLKILKAPVLSIKTKGRVPKKPKGPDPECDKKCANEGRCNHEKICQCPEGYMGQYCKTALCYPQCMNGGNCTAPGVCSCPPGYQGRHCEGGICSQKCMNGGKCIQKDTCDCPKGYYGLRCEFSKCVIPCLNKGRCKGVNKCKCPAGFKGDHCEVNLRVPNGSCVKGCKHGMCVNGVCECDPGWRGRHCQKTDSIEESGEYKKQRRNWHLL